MQLKSLRTSHHFTQEQIASVLGITRPAYANIENGKRQLDILSLMKLADLYSVSSDTVLGRCTEQKETPTANGGGLDEQLVNLLVSLSPSEVRRVEDFVAGLIAARGDGVSHQD